MLLWTNRAAEPGVVGCIEYPVRSDGIIDHMPGKDDLVADSDARIGMWAECKGAGTRTGEEIT